MTGHTKDKPLGGGNQNSDSAMTKQRRRAAIELLFLLENSHCYSVVRP